MQAGDLIQCERCGKLLDPVGCEDIGATPALKLEGRLVCSSNCGRALTGGCHRCKRPLGMRPLTIGFRSYCGGHCLSIDQCERSEKRLAETREKVGFDPVSASPSEVAARWKA